MTERTTGDMLADLLDRGWGITRHNGFTMVTWPSRSAPQLGEAGGEPVMLGMFADEDTDRAIRSAAAALMPQCRRTVRGRVLRWRFHGGFWMGCVAGEDGDCQWHHCPQIRDGEPERSGRHCPLDRGGCS